MGRLKKRKFDNIEGLLEFNENNPLLIQTETLEKLEKYYKSNQKIGLVDVFEVELLDSKSDPIKMTIFEEEWEEALNIGLELFLKIEKYDLAIRVRDLLKEIKIMTREQIYDLVNGCESIDGLKNVIKELTDENGMIQGRNEKFKAEKMIIGLDMFMKDEMPPNVITREFGLRQQAMYIKHYRKF